jgi:hypothetical protein
LRTKRVIVRVQKHCGIWIGWILNDNVERKRDFPMHYLLLGFPFAVILFAPWVVPAVRPLGSIPEND